MHVNGTYIATYIHMQIRMYNTNVPLLHSTKVVPVRLIRNKRSLNRALNSSSDASRVCCTVKPIPPPYDAVGQAEGLLCFVVGITVAIVIGGGGCIRGGLFYCYLLLLLVFIIIIVIYRYYYFYYCCCYCYYYYYCCY